MRYLIVLLLAGCAGQYIDDTRPPAADWPQLKETVVPTTRAEVRRRCPPSANYEVAGCATIYFARRECVILDSGVNLAHERMHCRGYDHPGETAIHDAWTRYKARGGI